MTSSECWVEQATWQTRDADSQPAFTKTTEALTDGFPPTDAMPIPATGTLTSHIHRAHDIARSVSANSTSNVS